MKIVFFGSDDFAAVHLEKLLEGPHEVAACVTGPDKPQGRGMKIAISPVKKIAGDHQVPCLQPATLKGKDTVEALKAFGADIFVVVAYGRLLTQEILDIPRMLCMNVHGSLLPKYRGAAPINWAILNGDSQTGVTIQKMALELDSGEIITQKAMAIDEGEDAGQLRARMAPEGAQLLADTLSQYPSGKFPLKPQDQTAVTYAPKLTKEMGKIDWKKPAETIIDQARGLAPWPGTYTFYQGKMLKIIKAQAAPDSTGSSTPGQVIKADKNGLVVACGIKGILIKEVQPEAGKVMSAASFIAGYKVAAGAVFG